jgi:hypothetical protein
MSIPPLLLDDLTWTDLTDASRRRIPAASRGRWTLHSPVDPGVTLLELHAWLLEQRLYWMDQVPDSLTRGALALLGDAANDALCAATVLHFPAGDGVVPAGTAMQVQDTNPPLIFTTDAATQLLPLAAASAGTVRPRIGLRIGGQERSIDLLASKPVCLFDDSDEVEITLWLQAPIPAGQDATALVVLDGPGVPSQWDAGAVDAVAPPAVLGWFYRGPDAAQHPFAQLRDGTGGLRRSGIIRFTVPADWTAGAADKAGNLPFTLWLRCDAATFTFPPRLIGLWPNVVIARHQRTIIERRELDWLKLPGNTIALSPNQQPPLTGGTMLRLREKQGWRRWQPTADLAFRGPRDRVFVIDRDAGMLRFGNGETGRLAVPADGFTLRDLADPVKLLAAWQSTDPLSLALIPRFPPAAASRIATATAATARSRPVLRALLAALAAVLAQPLQNEPALVARRDAVAALRGATPPLVVLPRLNRLLLEDAYPEALAAGQAELHLRIGGGAVGNVGAWLQWEPGENRSVPNAINVVAGQDGANSESLAAARERSAGRLRRVERAVLADDFTELACSTPGVAIARAHAAIGFHPDFPCLPVPGVVTVFIVPAAPRDEEPPCPVVVAPLPDEAARAAVVARLDSARLLGTEVLVRPPIYQPTTLTVTVQSNSASPDVVKAAIVARLTRFLDPLTGGDQANGWPFGEKLRPSVLLRQAQLGIADAGEVVQVAISLPAAAPPVTGESCNDVPIGDHALPALRQVTTRMTVPAVPVGGLT